MAVWCSLWLLPLMLATRRLFDGRVALIAGVAGAMAILPTLTALPLLVPLAAAAVGVHVAIGWRSRRTDGDGSWLQAPLQAAGLALTATATIACVAVWPALWVDPVEAIIATFESAKLASQTKPRLFLGEVIERGDWRFYPVAAYFRTSAWLFIGAIAAIVRRATGQPRFMSRRIALGLAAYTFPYLVLITFRQAVRALPAASAWRSRTRTWSWRGWRGWWPAMLRLWCRSGPPPLPWSQHRPWSGSVTSACSRLAPGPRSASPGRYVRSAQVAGYDPRLETYLRDHAELVFNVNIGGLNYVEVWRTIPTE